jgi:hypothetical protein
MKKFAALLAVLAMAAVAANASNPVQLGISNDVIVIGSGADACANGVLNVNHDGSFENGYAWQYAGSVAPYYGAFGEGYDLGTGTVFCGAYWPSTMPGYFYGQSADCYVWDGGVGGAPGAVLGVTTGVVFPNVPNWPAAAQNDVDLNVAVTGPFTVGFWGNWPGALCGYFCCADLNGFGGYPWTNIAPGIGYPTGWNDPSIVWGTTQSMAIGAWFGGCTPVEAQTWGSIKALFE